MIILYYRLCKIFTAPIMGKENSSEMIIPCKYLGRYWKFIRNNWHKKTALRAAYILFYKQLIPDPERCGCLPHLLAKSHLYFHRYQPTIMLIDNGKGQSNNPIFIR